MRLFRLFMYHIRLGRSPKIAWRLTRRRAP
jgi:hypothetical protein